MNLFTKNNKYLSKEHGLSQTDGTYIIRDSTLLMFQEVLGCDMFENYRYEATLRRGPPD
jgi:hypothetical protein